MALHTIKQAVKIALDDHLEDRGHIFREDHDVPTDVKIQLRIFGPPTPSYAYWEGPDGRLFCYTTQKLDAGWYYPFQWMVWTLVPDEETDEAVFYERDSTSVRFTDLRREAKEEALARLRAAESEVSV